VNDLGIGAARQDAASHGQVAVAFERPADDRDDSAAAVIDSANLDRRADLRASLERQPELWSRGRSVIYRLKHSRSRL